MVRATGGTDFNIAPAIDQLHEVCNDCRISRIIFPVLMNGTFLIYYRTGDGVPLYASIDPGDGQILRQGPQSQFPSELILHLHEDPLGNGRGPWLVMINGLAIVMMTLSGISYWWPKNGRWGGSLKINWNVSFRILLRQFHRSFAVLISLLSLTVAMTGTFLAYTLIVEAGPPLDARSGLASDIRGARIEEIVRAQSDQWAKSGIRDIRFPTGDIMRLLIWAPERNARAVAMLAVQIKTSQVIKTVPASEDHGLWVIPLPIHTGEAGGTVGRILVLICGVMLILLSISGVIMWLQRPKRWT